MNMKAQVGKSTFLALALLSTLVATLFAMGVFSVAQANEHSATRSFSANTVEPGALLTVTIAVSEYERSLTIEETLPSGFSFVSSGEGARKGDNQVAFVILREGVTSVSYTVTASNTEGEHTFSGVFFDASGSVDIGGTSMVTVESADSTTTDTAVSSLDVSPTSAKPGEAVTVTGMGSPAGATVHIFLAGTGVASATIADSGSFAAAFLVPDGATGGSNTVAARASSGATENLATDTLMVMPDFMGFSLMDGTAVTTINNDVSNPIYADLRGFGAGDVTFTANPGSVNLGSGSGQRVMLTIAEDTLAAGTYTITASQGSLNASAALMVVTPAIMLSSMSADNSMARMVTVTGTNFGPGTGATISADADGVATASANLASGGFTGTITLPAGTDAGEVTITATSGGYDAEASFMLNQATPGQVMGVVATPGEGNLAVTWTQVAAMTGAEVRPAATGYKVEWKLVSAAWADAGMYEADGGQAYHLISGLTPGLTYMVRVSAKADGTGYGMTSAITSSAVSTLPGDPPAVVMLAPAAPTSVMVSAIDHERLSVSWTAPARADNTPATTGYKVRYKTIGETSFSDPMDVDTILTVLTGLMPDTIYQVQVAAANSVGAGGYANGQGRTNAAPVIVLPPDRIKNGVALSSNNAGAGVRIDIDADADAAISGGEDIVVELPKFDLPSSIDESQVLIDSDGYSGNPSDVTVSGSKITIEVPTREGTAGGSMRTNIPAGDYSIKLKQGAGISNPLAAGDQTIKITDADAKAEEYQVTIMHVVSLSSDSVTRGDDLTLTLKGFANGTATVSINGTEVGQTEVSGNVGEFEIDTTKSAVKAGQDNNVTVVDSKGSTGYKASDSFTIKAKVAVDPDSSTPSKEVTIELSDWPSSVSVSDVSIGGIAIKGVSATTDDDGEASFKVMVPRNVNTGTQTVSVAGEGTTASTTIGINVLMLSVSPASAVPGQQVTISGSGFARNTKVAENGFKIGGNVVDPGSDATSTSSGNISITVVLPLDVGSGTKMVELEIAGRDGEGELMVPKPSIELTPAESVPGSVISVTGSNFAANERVEVSFAGAIEEIGRADGNGTVSVRLDIPSGAGVGSTNEVMIKTRPSDTEKYAGLNISAKADHKTPGPAITVSAEARVGGHITISGTNFESFAILTTVLVGGIDASPAPAPETDKNGAFEFQARVPRLSAGSHTVTIRDNKNNSATESFAVVTTPILSAPEEVFGGLTEAGVLGSVWRYSIDETGSDWDSYDPQYADQPGINDLEFVARGDIVWIRVTENVMFQGATLYAGWNLRTLE